MLQFYSYTNYLFVLQGHETSQNKIHLPTQILRGFSYLDTKCKIVIQFSLPCDWHEHMDPNKILQIPCVLQTLSTDHRFHINYLYKKTTNDTTIEIAYLIQLLTRKLSWISVMIQNACNTDMLRNEYVDNHGVADIELFLDSQWYFWCCHWRAWRSGYCSATKTLLIVS